MRVATPSGRASGGIGLIAYLEVLGRTTAEMPQEEKMLSCYEAEKLDTSASSREWDDANRLRELGPTLLELQNRFVSRCD
jgi:hypothetical protein